MRRLSWTVCGCLLLLGTEASAQFANRSLGLSVGYAKLNTDQPFEWAAPISLESSLYIENGFDLTLRLPLMIVTSRVTGRQSVGAGTSLGVRYLFSEETLRPYAGAELAFLYLFRDDAGQRAFFGLGPHAGVDYFVGDSVSIGLRGFFNLYVMLNVDPMSSFGAQLVVSTYF